jgi:hypothetical protein
MTVCIRTREVLDSNLGRDYRDWLSYWFSSVSPWKCSDHTSIRSHPSKYFPFLHSFITLPFNALPFYSTLCSTFSSLTNFYFLPYTLSLCFSALSYLCSVFILLSFLFSLSCLRLIPLCVSSSSNSPFVPTSFVPHLHPFFPFLLSLFIRLEIYISISLTPVAQMRTWIQDLALLPL